MADAVEARHATSDSAISACVLASGTQRQKRVFSWDCQ
eukprot:CAMPEP_0119539306 /NCGR_PEP_ID=MMETSP1344-20130328/51494_1 /TAXON_ID=236787 /ORGANISM="Florenciella parvula, Strain CCMP2471" /LENGTH=37 /DNA_ID= /DNA_START= /DNA_END= /DNA_ORIENTATION=